MPLTQKENIDLIIGVARNGNGIFAKRSFALEEIIFEVRGELIECNEDDDIDEMTRNNTYRYDENQFISPNGKIGDFLNHSCNPNAKVTKEGKKLFVRAIKNISIGMEILIDYSTITASDDSWTMQCNCGSKKCRRTIKKFKFLPKEIKERYLKINIVPSYILEI